MKQKLLAIIWLLMLWPGIFAQQTIQGLVTNENNQPIVGANVIVKGTIQGTITDIDGKFTLPDVNTNAIIVVSFVSMVSKEFNVGEQTYFEIQLKPDVLNLEDVVVIGYGTAKRKDLTGAVATVKSEEITMAPVNNTLEAIQGRVAGLDIARGDGRAGTTPSILLRGSRSFQGSSAPLYIIDGIEGSITNLNPADIVSIDILKDASSTAIYGVKGANGVILVTTKKAEKGKIQVDFSTYTSINSNPSFPSPLQGQAWIDYLEEGYLAKNGEPAEDLEDLISSWSIDTDIIPYIDTSKWINWMDETFQTGIQTNTSLSIRAGTDKIQSGFSVGYNSTEGIYKNDYLKKVSLRENLNIDATKWLKFGIVTGLTWQDRESRSSRVNKAFGMIPLGEVYDTLGNINQYPIAEITDNISILADDIEGTYRNNRKSLNITANPYIEINPFKGFSFRSILGTSLASNRSGIYNSDHTYMMLAGSTVAISNASYGNYFGYSYTWENILNYQTTLANDHNMGFTGITSYSHSQRETSDMYAEDFLYEDFLFYNLDAGVNQKASSDYSMGKRMSFAGRLNYNYKSRYYLSSSLRYDGASQLVEKWDVFPSASVAWRISEEPFLANTSDWLSNLKLRLGYGVAGSDNVGSYSSVTEVTNGSDALNLGSGELQTVVPTQVITNPYLRWEKTYGMNIGLDFAFFNGRIDGSAEWYNQDSKGLIYDVNQPFSSGGFGPKESYILYANVAAMNNRGIELTLNTRNVQTKDFSWNSTITFSRNWNEVLSIDLGSGTTPEQLISEGIFIGNPQKVYYSYKKTGIWQTADSADAEAFGLEPGDVRLASGLTKESDGVWYQTITKDDGTDSIAYYNADNPYQVNDDDREILGQVEPKWILGFNNTFNYKGFDLNIFVTARWGQMIQGELLGYFDYGRVNIPDNYDYWTESNPTNNYPRPYLSSKSEYNRGYDALSYVDGSYLKIKNISLGYTLPKSLMGKMKITNLRVYATVYNAFIFTKSDLLKGTDPETSASDSFPLYKQLVGGINFSF